MLLRSSATASIALMICMKTQNYALANDHPAKSPCFLIRIRMSEAISIFDVGRSMFDVRCSSLHKPILPVPVSNAVPEPFDRLFKRAAE